MREVVLDSLRCVNAPTLASIECLVQVTLDDADVREPYVLQQQLSNGESKPPADPFTRKYYFDSSVTFELVVEGNMPFGDHTVDSSTAEGTHTGTFSWNQYEFELEYTVSQDNQSYDPVQLAVDHFRDGQPIVNGDEFDRWHHLDHGDVVDRLEHIATPPEDANNDVIPDNFELDQADVGYCVMASIAFCSVSLQPRRFVEITRSLFETGDFLGRTVHEETSQTLQNSPVGDDLEDLEWLVFASLRDSKNFIDDVSADDLNEGAKWREAKYWLDQVLGFENATTHRAKVFGERDALQAASDAVDQNGAGILHVHKGWLDDDVLLFPDDNASRWQLKSDHAVALGEPVHVAHDAADDDDDRLLFSVHSWGDIKLIDMEWHHIENYLFATTVGTPS